MIQIQSPHLNTPAVLPPLLLHVIPTLAPNNKQISKTKHTAKKNRKRIKFHTQIKTQTHSISIILMLTRFSLTTAAAPFNSTTTFPFDSSAAVRLSYSSSTSMALTVVILLLVLFFIGFFSIFARRFFAGVHSTATATAAHRRPPLLLSTSTTTTSHSRRRYLSPYPAGAAAGLDHLAVRALPVLTYAGGGTKEAGGCVVCLGEFEEGERVKVIPGCGHVFHPGCIDGWLVLHGSCPICRCSEVWGAGVGAERNRGGGEVWVGIDDGGGPHITESMADSDSDSDDDEDEEGRKLAGLGRSKSFSSESAGDSRVFLRRTCSV